MELTAAILNRFIPAPKLTPRMPIADIGEVGIEIDSDLRPFFDLVNGLRPVSDVGRWANPIPVGEARDRKGIWYVVATDAQYLSDNLLFQSFKPDQDPRSATETSSLFLDVDESVFSVDLKYGSFDLSDPRVSQRATLELDEHGRIESFDVSLYASARLAAVNKMLGVSDDVAGHLEGESTSRRKLDFDAINSLCSQIIRGLSTAAGMRDWPKIRVLKRHLKDDGIYHEEISPIYLPDKANPYDWSSMLSPGQDGLHGAVLMTDPNPLNLTAYLDDRFKDVALEQKSGGMAAPSYISELVRLTEYAIGKIDKTMCKI